MSSAVTLDTLRIPAGPAIPPTLNLGTFMVADGAPFELQAARTSYADRLVARQIVAGRPRILPDGLVTDFSGLPGFFHVTITSTGGVTVLDRQETFCPNAKATQSRPDAQETSRFPSACATNPFALGAAWGISTGWAAPTSTADTTPVTLPDGTYTATISVNQPYRRLFNIQAGTQTVQVTARTVSPTTTSLQPTQPVAGPATGPGQPGPGLKPDLRPLPAWGITVNKAAGHDYLNFSATVWNAGPGPLVVQGFRRPGTDTMDAYQYFDDAQGHQVGHTRTGTMEWDPQPGHEHWHFTDFAAYLLLNSDQHEVVRSQKDGFCLANTDAIDTLVHNTTLNPVNTNLRSSCGGLAAISVREALAAGWGDTYTQTLPGQAFDITDLPNGTYYVQIIANPNQTLIESNHPHGASLRRIDLAGTPGHRTATAPPVGLING